MKLLYKLMRQDSESRDGIITVTSSLNIVVNVLIAGLKVLFGLITASMAIMAEGVNNATDAFSSILTLLGTKFAHKKPDKKHPFGYGRIEYLTGLVVSALILVTGIEMLISSVKLIFNPEELNISVVSIIIVGITAVVKLIMGIYTIKMGEKAESSSLKAVGVEGRNDCIVSVLTIASAVIFIIFGLSLDAYASIITSLIIIKAGGEILIETLSDIIGRPGERELAELLYGEIKKTEGVYAAADMMLHNYGPDAWSGSVNIEIDHNKTVGEVYAIIHELQLRIMHEYKVTMVFGIYAVDEDRAESKELRRIIAGFVKSKEHVKSYHAVYIDRKENKIYCDFIVDYELNDWDEVRTEFCEYMKEYYPGSEIELTVETEFV